MGNAHNYETPNSIMCSNGDRFCRIVTGNGPTLLAICRHKSSVACKNAETVETLGLGIIFVCVVVSAAIVACAGTCCREHFKAERIRENERRDRAQQEAFGIETIQIN